MKERKLGEFHSSLRICYKKGVYLEMESYKTRGGKYRNIVHQIDEFGVAWDTESVDKLPITHLFQQGRTPTPRFIKECLKKLAQG